MAELKDNKKTYTDIGSILTIVCIVALSLMLVWWSEGYRKDFDRKEQIGESLCETNNFIYVRMNSIPQTIVCKSNITYTSEHYNISPETLEIIITPDWDYYQKNETAK